MDEQKKTAQERRAERRKYARIQRNIRMGAILFAIVLAIIALAQSCSAKKSVKALKQELEAQQSAQAQAEAAAQAETSPEPSPEAQGTTITLSFVGDCTLGQTQDGDFDTYYENYGESYFFQNVQSIFDSDDLTIANLEGTLTQDQAAAVSDPIQGDPAYSGILTAGGIDAVTVANDHIQDYGDEGYVDTLAYLDNAGVERFGAGKTLKLQVSGVTLGLVGIDAQEDWEAQALSDIQSLKNGGAEIVIVELHWGETGATEPTSAQQSQAHNLIDGGADLVIGHGSQTLQGVELYGGKYIAYSLGSFCLSGSTQSAEWDTAIFQETFTVLNGEIQNAEINLIPCSVSNQSDENTYCPTPASGDEAQRILNVIYDRSALLPCGIQGE
jgi:poly-gamma-glutamate synthesis protein (capsule biosynthesis protein)